VRFPCKYAALDSKVQQQSIYGPNVSKNESTSALRAAVIFVSRLRSTCPKNNLKASNVVWGDFGRRLTRFDQPQTENAGIEIDVFLRVSRQLQWHGGGRLFSEIPSLVSRPRNG